MSFEIPKILAEAIKNAGYSLLKSTFSNFKMVYRLD